MPEEESSISNAYWPFAREDEGVYGYEFPATPATRILVFVPNVLKSIPYMRLMRLC
jgi:hypothetical protein